MTLTDKVASLPRLPSNFLYNQLTSLQIANNRIQEIEGHIFRALPNLKTLNAQKNRLKVIDGAISFCSELTSVLLDSNQLTVLPIEMHLLKKLKILKVSDNHITHLMFGARDLVSLEVLHLQENQLKTLPSEMHRLRKLRELRLESNKIEKFNLRICYMPNLAAIGLDWF